MRTTAVRKGDHYVINGYKRWITKAQDADFLQLVAATDRSKGSRGGLSMFLVDTATPGVKIVRRTPTMMSDMPCEIALDDVIVPAENLIGKEGEGMRQAQSWITAGRLYQACRGLGVAKRCLDLAVSYAKQRVTFGAPLADRQAVQFMIADSFTEQPDDATVRVSACRADRCGRRRPARKLYGEDQPAPSWASVSPTAACKFTAGSGSRRKCRSRRCGATRAAS